MMIKKPQLLSPNQKDAAIVAATPPCLTAHAKCLQAIQAAFNATPATAPTPTEYIIVPTIPVPTHVPNQMPSVFVPPPPSILPILLPYSINTEELLGLLTHSITENATNISNVEQLLLPNDTSTRPIAMYYTRAVYIPMTPLISRGSCCGHRTP